MRRTWPLVIALCLTRPLAAADVQVRVNGALVDIQATAAPLQDVLARLAQQTGMKVVYDGPPPRTLVTLTLTSRTPPEAVLSLFEGLGVNYAMMLDRTGSRVDTLLITGVSTGGGATSTGPSRPAAAIPPQPQVEQRGRPQRPANPAANENEADDDQDDEPGRPTPPGRGPGGLNPPVQGGPAQPGAPLGGPILPLALPTPSPLATSPSPTPAPTPNPGRLEGR